MSLLYLPDETLFLRNVLDAAYCIGGSVDGYLMVVSHNFCSYGSIKKLTSFFVYHPCRDIRW